MDHNMLNKLTFRQTSHRYFIVIYVKLICIAIISTTHIYVYETNSYNLNGNIFNIMTYKTNLSVLSMLLLTSLDLLMHSKPKLIQKFNLRMHHFYIFIQHNNI